MEHVREELETMALLNPESGHNAVTVLAITSEYFDAFKEKGISLVEFKTLAKKVKRGFLMMNILILEM